MDSMMAMMMKKLVVVVMKMWTNKGRRMMKRNMKRRRMRAKRCVMGRFAMYLRRMLLWGRPSWRALLVRVGCLSAVLGPLITNDATCVFLTPIVEEIAIR